MKLLVEKNYFKEKKCKFWGPDTPTEPQTYVLGPGILVRIRL